MNILYLVFGNRISDHIQAHLSIRSFLRHVDDKDSIFVITNKPKFYERFKGVTPIGVTDKTLREWEGSKHFFWRVKIKAIEYIAKKYPDQHLLYLDSDTVLTSGLSEIKNLLDKGKGLMHKDEGHPGKMKTKSLRMWKQVCGNTYGGVTIGEKHNMWNAGVVAIPAPKLQEVISLALTLCDGIVEENVERVVIEQWSLSIALYETTSLVPAEQWIAHYWGNKEQWLDVATKFFLESYMAGRTIEEDMKEIDNLPIKDLPIHIKKSNTQRRLVRFIKKIFPDKL